MLPDSLRTREHFCMRSTVYHAENNYKNMWAKV